MKVRFFRDEILMLAGAGLFGVGALALLGFFLSGDTGEKGFVGGMILTIGMLVGGAVTFRVGLGFRRTEKRLGRILEVLRTVDRTDVRAVARTVGISPEDARKGILYLISRGYVGLRFDPNTDKVFSPGASRDGWLKLPAQCPNCDAPCPNMMPLGSTPRCEYCDASLPVEKISPERATTMWRRPSEGGSPRPSPGMGTFSGNWGLLIVLFIFFWPAGVVYLIKGLNKHGGGKIYHS